MDEIHAVIIIFVTLTVSVLGIMFGLYVLWADLDRRLRRRGGHGSATSPGEAGHTPHTSLPKSRHSDDRHDQPGLSATHEQTASRQEE